MKSETVKLFSEFIIKQPFLTLGTSNLKSKPHNSPKLLVKIDKRSLFIVDYVKGYTFQNIKANPYVSISTFHMENIQGYHAYGRAKIINSKDSQWPKLEKKLEARQVEIGTDQVVSAVQGQRKLKLVQFTFLKPKVFYRIHLTRIRKIDAGKLLK